MIAFRATAAGTMLQAAGDCRTARGVHTDFVVSVGTGYTSGFSKGGRQMTLSDRSGDGLYRYPTEPCPDCDGEIAPLPRSDELLCSENPDHRYNRGVPN